MSDYCRIEKNSSPPTFYVGSCTLEAMPMGVISIGTTEQRGAIRTSDRGFEIDRPLFVMGREVSRPIQVINITPPAEPAFTLIDAGAVWAIMAALLVRRLVAAVIDTYRRGIAVGGRR
jgi:hypothetical protein